jgi:dTDP-4-amino-4,6-dideoxygalactose transaminase
MSRISAALKLLCRPGWAAGTDLVESYERSFAATVLQDQRVPCLAFWRGRVALWSMLRAMNVGEGDEVVVSAFTCDMVPAAVKFSGARCAYADIAPRQFNASIQAIQAATTQRTRAIVCQHTYGIAQPVQGACEWASARSIKVLEDCCQLIYHDSREGRVGLVGAGSFFSTQWNKPFSTGLGGISAFRDHDLYVATGKVRESFSHKQDRRRAASLALQVLAYELTVRPATPAVVARAYRWAQASGLVRGTTTVEEYGAAMPDDYAAGGLNIQAVLGMQQLRQWRRNVSHRRRLTRFYLDYLTEVGADTRHLEASGEPVLWAVPLQVRNRAEILHRAESAGLQILAWFDTLPAHVDPASAGRYDYRPGRCPRSERAIRCEIYLPTAPSVTMARAEAAVRLLKAHARLADE